MVTEPVFENWFTKSDCFPQSNLVLSLEKKKKILSLKFDKVSEKLNLIFREQCFRKQIILLSKFRFFVSFIDNFRRSILIRDKKFNRPITFQGLIKSREN